MFFSIEVRIRIKVVLYFIVKDKFNVRRCTMGISTRPMSCALHTNWCFGLMYFFLLFQIKQICCYTEGRCVKNTQMSAL